MPITKRGTKGSRLTHAEMDANLSELETAIENINGLADFVNGTILDRVNSIESVTTVDLSPLEGRASTLETKVSNLESNVYGYTFLDVFNNVYKNLPNHTEDLSQGRIRVLELLRTTAVYGGVTDARWDQWMDYVRYNNESALLNDIDSMGVNQRMQFFVPLIALINYRVYAFNKIYGRSYLPMTLDNFYSWNPGTQWNTDISTFNNSLNNIEASDNVLYAQLKNNTMTPFTADTKVYGWTPL